MVQIHSFEGATEGCSCSKMAVRSRLPLLPKGNIVHLPIPGNLHQMSGILRQIGAKMLCVVLLPGRVVHSRARKNIIGTFKYYDD